jgi:hypothetical protein
MRVDIDKLEALENFIPLRWRTLFDQVPEPTRSALRVAYAKDQEAWEQLQLERDSFKNQVEYERQARIDAANFPRNRNGYIPCQRCGIDCGMDAIIPNELWDAIAPEPEWPEAGMFCLWCMDELLAEKGLSGRVKIYFPGKALLSEMYEVTEQAEARETALRDALELAKDWGCFGPGMTIGGFTSKHGNVSKEQMAQLVARALSGEQGEQE